MAAPTISGRSVTLGLSLTHRGSRLSARPSAAASTARMVPAGEWANIRRRSSRLGQEMLASTATMLHPSSVAAAAATPAAARRKSAAEEAQMLTTTRAPVAARAGRWWRRQASTPGFCRPTLLSIPTARGCRRGAGLPGQGSADNDLATVAPRSDEGEKGGQLDAEAGGPRGRQDGVGELDAPDGGGQVQDRLAGASAGGAPVGPPRLSRAGLSRAGLYEPASHEPRASCSAAWYSCRLRTARRWVARSAIPAAAARAAAMVVRHTTRWAVAARRMWAPSARGPRPGAC